MHNCSYPLNYSVSFMLFLLFAHKIIYHINSIHFFICWLNNWISKNKNQFIYDK
jgi:hypothetical protein